MKMNNLRLDDQPPSCSCCDGGHPPDHQLCCAATAASVFHQQSLDHNGDEPQRSPPPSMTGASAAKHSRFPVEIIPFLFLGDASNAADLATLIKYNIRYILNVTPDLPNVFEHDTRFKYLQIPISDHWSQNLAEYFPLAISFINKARSEKCGVLVHCLAGISRSVTVTVAYLMQTLSISLDEAYDLVRSHKPNVSPNFNFMGQLVEFERIVSDAWSGLSSVVFVEMQVSTAKA
ncbi:unnamed protein product [Soboliphyme baturini]|uniref:protein-tyrosine-phosphatase n=1 Tax=Soboliphyme baturini TaxID=241478 RepID=A0A183IS18_9BILA|nr:unnamed protein product [Soboliphyme baturini]